jgi:hypothetical protein
VSWRGNLGWSGGLVVIGGGFVIALIGSRPTSPARLSLRRETASRFRSRGRGAIVRAGFLSGAGFVVCAGVGTGLALWQQGNGLRHSIISGLVVGLLAGLVAGMPAALLTAMTDDEPQTLGPRDVITGDVGYTLATVFVSAFVVAAVFDGIGLWVGYGYQAELAYLAGGLLIGGAVGIVLRPSACVRYLLAVTVNRVKGNGPLRFGGFLDWAHDAGLLRISGVAYQFRHRQLQDWLTTPGDAPAAVPAVETAGNVAAE